MAKVIPHLILCSFANNLLSGLRADSMDIRSQQFESNNTFIIVRRHALTPQEVHDGI